LGVPDTDFAKIIECSLKTGSILDKIYVSNLVEYISNRHGTDGGVEGKAREGYPIPIC
jgi:hypothetical protein